MKQASECRRCGKCCRLGGPSLTAGDEMLVREGTLAPQHLVTLRAGQWIRNDAAGRTLSSTAEDPGAPFLPLGRELVKLDSTHARDESPWQCLFFDMQERTGTCAIYAQRPEQCRILFCDDTAPLLALLQGELADRRTVLSWQALPATAEALRLEIMEAHDALCPSAAYAALQQQVLHAYSPSTSTAEVAAMRRQARQQMEEMQRRDTAFRSLCVERRATTAEELPFLLGLPLRSWPMPDADL